MVDLGIAFGYEQTMSSFAESAAILISILVVTNVAASNDYRKQSQFRKLNAVVENMEVVVVRNSQKRTVRANDIVVGDVVTLSVGDIICADGILIDGHGVQTDESSLTGETKEIKKSDQNPFLLSGTKVMAGTGTFLAIAVGENSAAGQIRMIVQGGNQKATADHPQEENDEQPAMVEIKSVLTEKLNTLATNIGKVGTLVASICFVARGFGRIRMRGRTPILPTGEDYVSEHSVHITHRLKRKGSHEAVTSSPLDVTRVAETLIKTKRHEGTAMLARGMTRRGDELAKRELVKAGRRLQVKRKSQIHVKD